MGPPMYEILTGFDPSFLVAFIVAGLLLNLTPGVDFVLISTTGMRSGTRLGIAAAIGVNLGVWVHILAAVGGVSALLLAYPFAYDAIRYVGAAYLAWMAWQAWNTDEMPVSGPAELSAGAAVRRGFLTNVLNPKTALFIFAFIPQFTDPTIGPISLQLLILGAIFQINGFIFTVLLAVAAGALAPFLKAHFKALNKITAVLLGGLAARLAIP